MKDKNYYEILEVSESASLEEIRHAFQHKARRLHPDVNKDATAEAEFKEVSEAYAVLSDPEKRRRYDALRSGNPFGGFSDFSTEDASNPFSGFGGFPFSGFGFSQQKKASTPAYNPRPGANIYYNLTLDEKEARTGGTHKITYERFVPCSVCHGAGSTEALEPKTCPTCHGSGKMSIDLGDLFGAGGFPPFEVPCPECDGTGKVVADPCTHCGGSGRILAQTEELITVPPKTHDAQEVVVPYMGHAGTNKQKAGDLHVRIAVPAEQVLPQARFGFACIGFALPFLILSAFMQVLSELWIFVAIPFGLGLFLVASELIKKHNRFWWKNAGQAFLEGATNGFLLAAILTLITSCSVSGS